MFGRKKIGIALSGGAARGIAHIGVLEVMEDLGVNVGAVSGCSMGAIIGAIYSLGISCEEMISFVKKTDWRGFLLMSVLSPSKVGIVNDKKVDGVLSRFLGNKTFDDCKKPFCCVAVDLISGKKAVLKSGSLKEAVRASIAVPGLFQPVLKGNQLLVDGGIVEPLPTDALGVLDCNYIIASSIVFDREDEIIPESKMAKPDNDLKKMSVYSVLDKSMNLMHAQMVKGYLQKADIIIEPRVGGFGFFDFTKAEKIIEAGRVAAKRKVPEIKRKLRIR